MTIKKMIEKCHPHSVYAEADISEYNLNANSFVNRGRKWGINLDRLKDGPMIMPMLDNHGEVFWGFFDTKVYALTNSVSNYVARLEYDNWGAHPEDCDIERIIKEVNDHIRNDDWNPYNYYKPQKKQEVIASEEEEQSSSKSYQLSEPEKAFLRRR